MANRDPEEKRAASAGHTPATGTPRWVKAFATIALLLVVMVVIMLLSGGNHGPARHSSDHTPATAPLADHAPRRGPLR